MSDGAGDWLEWRLQVDTHVRRTSKLASIVADRGDTLRTLDLQPEYRSDCDYPVDDFYIPCFERSTVYRRAVGYFTSQSLALAAKGLAVFLRSGGKVQLVASPALTPEDIDAIERGYAAQEEIVARALLRPLTPLEDAVSRDRLSVLAWLIAEGKVEIRLAVRRNALGQPVHGIYHEKIGIFSDESGNAVAFTGSANETEGGLISNFESIDVFCSWIDSIGRVQRKIDNFDRLWENRTSGLAVLPFPEAVRQRLLELCSPERPTRDPEQDGSPLLRSGVARQHHPKQPSSIDLRDYQKAAIRSWFVANGRGLFKMATGTGKTITALSLLVRLWTALRENGQPLAVIIVCPYRHLVTQWAEECTRFGFQPLRCFETRVRWARELDADLLSFSAGQVAFLPIVTTNSTFSTPAFQERLSRISGPVLLIADEAHNLGSDAFRKLLPEAVPFRLGLSATPERWYDEEGTEALLSYFGEVVFQYGLQEAIEGGALTNYDYFPIIIELTTREAEEYVELSHAIATRFARENRDEAGDMVLKSLLLRRARLLASAENKLPALQTLLKTRRNTAHNLVYCGDGRVDDETGENERRQIDAAVQLIGRGLGMKVDSYTAETRLDERDRLRDAFAAGDLQVLVAIRCLDEGVDIPQTHRAFILASSTNPKQFIQRRGRVLRRAPGKDVAEIYDFIVVPPPGLTDTAVFNVDRRLLKRELQRVVEFASLARNCGAAATALLPLKKKYNLLDLG